MAANTIVTITITHPAPSAALDQSSAQRIANDARDQVENAIGGAWGAGFVTVTVA